MNAPIKIAQVATQTAAPEQVIRLVKPESGQAITVKTGFEGKIKLDFSAIADERITIVRVGETAVIFFHDNKSTITLDPFFGSGNLPLANLEFDLGGNRIFSAEQIAGILPFTVYQGILPAAGEAGAGNEQAAGANFNPTNVEGLPPIVLNLLLPPEALGPIDLFADTSALFVDEIFGPSVTGSFGTLFLFEHALDLFKDPPSSPGDLAAGLVEGTHPGSREETTDTQGVITGVTFTAGSSAITSIKFADPNVSGNGITVTDEAGNVIAVTWVLSPDGTRLEGTYDGAVAIILQISASEYQGDPADVPAQWAGPFGSVTPIVTVTLTKNFPHSDTIDEPGDSNRGADDLVTLAGFKLVATDSNTLEVTSEPFSVGVGDDAPMIDTSGTVSPLTVDESNFSADVSASFASLFVWNFGADGFKDTDNNDFEDADAITYALGINAGATGIVDTLSNEAVVLSLESGAVVGRTALTNEIVFTITVDTNTGMVTLDQSRAVVHDDPNDPDESSAPTVLAAANLITLTATITDGDGDTNTATAEIGTSFAFEDDGPSIIVSGSVSPLTVDETDFDANASGSFATLFLSSFGADGFKDTDNDDSEDADAITYKLGVVAGPSGLVDTLTNEAVILSVNAAGTVVTGASATGGTVFTITVDPDTGDVTLDQSRAVVHSDPDPSNHDEPISLAGELITLTATITDGDGDTATATANIGGSFTFEDDGPSILVSGTAPVLTVDETNFGLDANASFAGLFAPLFGADGFKDTDNDDLEDADAITYALGVVAGPSGLVDTLTNEAVILSVNAAGTIVTGASATGGTVFTITVDTNTGMVTLDQSRAVVHDDPNDPDESSAPTVLAPANLITLTATITDGDGDTNTATAEIGASFAFEDDGPSISVSGTAPVLTVDETNFGLDANASFAGLFAPLFGADGFKDTDNNDLEDADAVTYALGINAGATGIVDTLSNEAVVLSLESGAVVGRTALTNEIVFTITVDTNTGMVTLDQSRAVVHDDPNDPDESSAPTVLAAANLITLTATITDGDGDTNTATAEIGASFAFRDDGPSITLESRGAPQFVLDESIDPDATDPATAPEADDPAGPSLLIGSQTMSVVDLFNAVDYGADGPGSEEYRVVLKDGAGNDAAIGTTYVATNFSVTDAIGQYVDDVIYLHQISAYVINGLVGGAGGALALRIEINPSTGAMTVEQYLPIAHGTDGSTPAAHDDLATLVVDALGGASGGIFAALWAVDKDGDSVATLSGSPVGLTIEDDGPKFVSAQSGKIEAEPGETATGAINFDFGTDGPAGILDSGEHPFDIAFLTEVSPFPGVTYTYTEGGTLLTATLNGGDTYFTVKINPDDTYTFTLVNLPTTTAPLALQNITGAFAPVPSKDFGAFTFSALPTHNVNGSGAGVGINDDNLEGGDTLIVMFDNPMTVANLGLNHLGGSNITLQWKAYSSEAPGLFETGSVSIGADGTFTVDILGHIDGTTNIPSFDTLEIVGLAEGNGSGKVKILSVSGTQIITETDIGPFVFNVIGTDGDGDTTQGSFTVSVNKLPTVEASDGVVYETALGTIAGDEGTNEFKTAGVNGDLRETVTGTVTFTEGDPVATVVIGGVTIDLTPGAVTIVPGANGTLTVTTDLVTPGLLNWSYTLTNNLSHPDAGNIDLADLLLGENFAVTVTDVDGEVATGDIQISVADDGPEISWVSASGSLSLDETTAGTPGGFPIPFTTLTPIVFFSPIFGADGAAAGGGVAYTLSPTGGPHNLATAIGDFPITLVQNGPNTIEGRYDGSNVAFSVTFNSDGTLTVTQNVPLEHLIDGDDSLGEHNDTLNLTGLITGTVTITDGDGDQDSESLDIGALITFYDDGPSISAVSGTSIDLTLDETIGFVDTPLDDTTVATVSLVTGQVPFGERKIDGTAIQALFGMPDFGADGPAAGSGASVYSLSQIDGSSLDGEGTGLWLTGKSPTPADEIILVLNGDVLEGREGGAGGTLAFAIRIDPATGEFTVQQFVSLDHGDPLNPDDSVNLDDLLYVKLTVTDGDGDTAFAVYDGTIFVYFEDDGPKANLDTGNVSEGGLLSVAAIHGILSNDTAGADGATIAGVRAAGGDTTTAVTNGVMTVVTTLGTLTVQADGSYTYQSNANTITGAAQDQFVYTLRDGDGDLSTTTLTINLSDVSLLATSATAEVNEAALDTTIETGDIAAGLITGSNPTSGTETATGTLNATGGVGALTYALQTGGNAVTAGTYGSIQINTDGSFTYTLTKNYLNATANNGPTTIPAVESFIYTVTDSVGNTTTSSIVINIVDDVPTARNDDYKAAAEEGGVLPVEESTTFIGNLLLGTPGPGVAPLLSFADTLGADGGTVTQILATLVAAPTTTDVVSGGTTIAGLYGTLTINPDGSFSYTANNNIANLDPAEKSDFFIYTVTDGDGDVSTALLSIVVKDGQPMQASGSGQLVLDEKDLDATGSTPLDTGETHSTTVTFIPGTDDFTVFFAPNAVQPSTPLPDGSTIVWTLDPGDATNRTLLGKIGTETVITLTLTGQLTGLAGGAAITPTVNAVLHDNFPHALGADVLDLTDIVVEARDVEGHFAHALVHLKIHDDKPIANDDTDSFGSGAVGTFIEGNIFTGAGTNEDAGGTGTDIPGADGAIVGGILGPNGSGATSSLAGIYTVIGNFGTLTLDSTTGAYSYTRTVATAGSDTFTYTLRDGDGDDDPATLIIDLANSALPTVTSASVVVDEDDLNTAQGALFQGLANTSTGDDIPSGQTGSLGSYGPDGQGGITFPGLHLANVVDTGAAPVQRDGVTLKYFWDGPNNTLYGTTVTTNATLAEQNASFKLVVNQTNATYEFTLLKHVDHAPGNNENDINLSIGYEITDSTNDNVPGVLNVKIDDDLPVGGDDDVNAIAGVRPTANIVLVIDTSGSMGDGFTAGTAMSLAKAAAISLLNSTAVDFNKIMVVQFNTNASVNTEGVGGPVWTSKQDAIDYINDLDGGGNTNYDAALAAVTTNWLAGPTEAMQTLLYFISDGAPQSGDNTIGIVDTLPGDLEIQNWQNFLASAPVGGGNLGVHTAYAIGVGANVNTGNLDPISWAPGNPGLPPVLISSASELSVLLTGSLPGNPSGNIFDNAGGFGADGGVVQSITVNGTTYTYAANPSGQVTITTNVVSGAKLIFNFADNGLNKAGDWDYFAPTAGSTGTEVISYVLADGDGDLASGLLDIQVLPPPTLSVSSPTADESAGFIQFTVALSHATLNPVAVGFALANGTATGSGTDFGPGLEWSLTGAPGTWSSGAFSFAPGQTSVFVRTPINNDLIDEPAENFTLTATAAGGTSNPTAVGTGTITDNDPAVTFSINDVSAQEGVNPTITFTVTKTGLTAFTSTVDYAVTPGSATTPADYTGTLTGTLTFAPGETTKTITLNVVNDGHQGEPSEQFTVNLSSPTNATITTGTGHGTIIDAPPNAAPTLALNTFTLTPQVNTVSDNFQSNNYTGGSGWASNWTETGDDNSATIEGGTRDDDIGIQPDGGSGNLALNLGDWSDSILNSSGDNDDASVQRTVNLSGATSATLQFDIRSVLSDSNDDVLIQVSSSASGPWTTLITFDNANDVATYQNHSFDISAFISATTTIRFVATGGMEEADFAWIDNVGISFTTLVPVQTPSTDYTTSYTENGAAVSIAAAVPTIIDTDNAMMQGATITIIGDQAGDLLTNNLLVGGIVIDPASTSTQLILTGPGTIAQYQAVLAAITFSNTGHNPGTLREIEVTVTDGISNSNVAKTTVNITTDNDAPTANDDIVLTNITDFSAISIPNAALLYNDTDPDSTLTVSGVSGPSGGTVVPGAVFDPANPPATTQVVKTYTFLGKTAGLDPHSAYQFEVDPGSSSPNSVANALSSIQGGTGGTTPVEATNTQYGELSTSSGSSSGSHMLINDPGSGDHAVFWAQFTITEEITTVTRLEISVEGHQNGDPGSAETGHLGIWNYVTGSWVTLDSEEFDDSDGTWTNFIETNVSQYIHPTTKQVTIAVVNEDPDQSMDIDYVEVVVTSQQPGVIFDENFSTGAGGFGYVDNFFAGTGNFADGTSNTGLLHLDLGGSNGTGATNMNGAFTRTINLDFDAEVTLTFQYRAQLSGNTGNGENVQVLARLGTTDLGVVHEIAGNGSNSTAHDSGWQTFNVTLNLSAGSHTLVLGGLMTSKNNTNDFADIDFDNVKVTFANPSFGEGSFNYTASDGSQSDGATVTIEGQAGASVVGTAANEILIGRAGASDTLTGNGGADVFVLNGTAVDTITDYDFAEGDALDLTDLLNDIYGVGNDGSFGNVRLIEGGGDVMIQVETGSSGSNNWADVAVLDGYSTGGSDPVKVLIDSAQQTYTV